LKALLGEQAKKLREDLKRANDDDARLQHFASWLEARFHCINRPALAFRRGAADVSARRLAQSIQVNPRSLRRQFARDIGVSPKQWLKLCRLDGVLLDQAFASGSETLAGVALNHGYADQSHFARDVARLAGTTPAVLRRRLQGTPPHLLPNG
jgi:AraC-like DNA-binding protein